MYYIILELVIKQYMSMSQTAQYMCVDVVDGCLCKTGREKKGPKCPHCSKMSSLNCHLQN